MCVLDHSGAFLARALTSDIGAPGLSPEATLQSPCSDRATVPTLTCSRPRIATPSPSSSMHPFNRAT